MKEFAKKGVNFTLVKVNEECNAMIEVMKANYGANLVVTDLAKACST